MSSIPYSSAEHAAFNLSDQLEEDTFPMDRQAIRKLLGELAYSSHRARSHLDRAVCALGEKNKAKRENIAAIIKMERADD
jgi:hypothetical protein